MGPTCSECCLNGAQTRHVHVADRCEVGMNSCLAAADSQSQILSRPSVVRCAKYCPLSAKAVELGAAISQQHVET